MSNSSELLSKIRELETELKHLKKQKRYGLVWEDKPETVVEQCKTELPVLTADDTRTISEDQNGPTHILIEGDNYHALSVLAYTHEKQVDVIYIDPPYNTGNRDFMYNDSFVDREDSFRHSKWLSFMSKRLEIAKKLLKDTGVIFISIDDNEQAQLKLLCDEIFSDSSFHGIITWKKKDIPVNIGSARHNLQSKMEYILLYSRCDQVSHPGFNTQGGKERLFPHFDDLGNPCRLENLLKGSMGAANRETLKFDILGYLPPSGKQWQIGKETMEMLLEQNPPRIILRNGIPKKVVYPEDEGASDGVNTFWSHLETGTASTGKKLLSKIVEQGKNFDTVKPLDLLMQLIARSSHRDSIILDFFAGSGTTGHAVLELNREDGGKRQCILVTNNENQIAEEVTYPRLRNVIRGYADVAGIPANLRYYRTDFVAVDRSIDDLRSRFMGRCSEMLCIREGCFEEYESEQNPPTPLSEQTEQNPPSPLGQGGTEQNLSTSLSGGTRNGEYFQVFENATTLLAIVYHPYEIERLRTLALATTKEIVVYIFSMGTEIFEEELAHLSDCIRIETIPDEILETYKKIFGF